MLPCEIFHPLEPSSCTMHAAKRFVLGLKASLAVYVPVHIIPLLLFRFKAIMQRYVPNLLIFFVLVCIYCYYSVLLFMRNALLMICCCIVLCY